MIIRSARYEDCRFVYDLAMQPNVREMSTRSDWFSYEQHCEWWDRRFNEPATRIFIGEAAEAIGYVRYGTGAPAAPGLAEVAVAVMPEARGLGYGHQLLVKSRDVAICELAFSGIDALILPKNQVSIRLFTSADYNLIGEVERMGKQHFVYHWMVS